MAAELCALPILALLAACSGGQADIDNADTTSEPQLAATGDVTTSEPTGAPSSTGVNAIAKLGKICTQIGCRDQLLLQAPDVKLAAGTYLLAIDADGKKSTCPLVVSAKGITSEGCVGDAGAKLALPGGVPIAGAEGGFSLAFGGAPASVTVSLTSSTKKKVGEQAITPTYKTLQPNGADCSPTCKQGQETLQLK